MTIEELITFCEEEEYNHRLKCKRYDDASGYTRSKDKNIRTACAIREDTYADFYKEISDTMRKYQILQADCENRLKADMVAMLGIIRAEVKALSNSNPSYWHSGDMVDRDDVLEILDQHKAEIKPQERET